MSLLQRLLQILCGSAEPPPPVTPPPGDFERALAFTLKWEGGKVDDPDDPGGRTNMGITQTTYDNWNTAKGAPWADVWGITPTEVANIYRVEYWEEGHCEPLYWPLSLVHFDSCVQFGPARAIVRFLEKTSDPIAYINLRREWHRQRVADVPSQAKFLRGWLNRCDALAKEAITV